MRRLCLSADRHAANAVAIGDRGLRSLLTYGAALLLSGSILSAAAPSFALLAVAQGVLGIGIGLLVAIGIAAVVRHTGKEAVRRNARLVALMEQVGAIDDRFRAWRQETGRAFVDRNTAGIRSLQRRGLADPNLDPDLAARAVGDGVADGLRRVRQRRDRRVARRRARHCHTALGQRAAAQPGSVKPASTTSVWPVTLRAASDRKNTTASAMSSGSSRPATARARRSRPRSPPSPGSP